MPFADLYESDRVATMGARPKSVFLDVERFEIFAAGGLHEDLDLLFGILERGLAGARELDAVLELLHGFFQRQFAGFEFFDQQFEVSDGFFQVNGFLCVHVLNSWQTAALRYNAED